MYNDPNQPSSPYGQPSSPYGQPPSPYGQPSSPYDQPQQPPPPPYQPVPTAYGQPQQPPPPPYEPVPTMYVQPQQVPPSFVTPPVQRRSRRGLWITLSAIIGVLVVGATIAVIVVLNLPNTTTPSTTNVLNSYCDALKSGDYQSAYNLYTSDAQKDLGAETDFAASYRSFGTVTSCTVSNVDDSHRTAMLSLTFPNGLSLAYDTQAISDKINSRKLHSTPSSTLSIYCAALKSQDYQTAYNQLSSAAQSQVGSADQLAASFSITQVKDCTVSNVNDTAGTGTISYTGTSGTTVTADYTLVTENGVWKLDTEKVR